MSFIADLDRIIEESRDPLLASHRDWPRVRLGTAAEVLNGFAFKSARFTTNKGIPLIRIRDLKNKSTSLRYDGDYEQRYIVERGALLIGMDGDFKVARWTGEPALLNQRVCKLTINPTRFDPRFVELVLPGYLDAIHEATSSQTVKHLSSRDITDIPLPCPPLAEQRRILEKVESLLARVTSTDVRLKNANKRVGLLRLSVIGAAYDGSLIGENVTDYLAFAQVCNDLRGGNSTTSVRGETDWPVLKSSAVRPFKIDFGDSNYLRSADECAPNAEVSEGDLLITRLSGSVEYVGNCALVRPRPPGPLQIPDRIFRARVRPEFDPRYVEIMFNAPIARKPLEEAAKSSAGHQRISLSDVRAVAIPWLSPAQQKETVRRFEALMVGVEVIERRICSATELANHMAEAILAKAFTGELVPNEAELARREGRSDEPASELLERVRAQVERTPPRKQRSR